MTSAMATGVRRSSVSFVPQFMRVLVPTVGARQDVPELGIALRGVDHNGVSGASPDLSAGECSRGRYSGILTVLVAMTDDGMPLSEGHSGRIHPVCHGVAEVVVGGSRLVGALLMGDSILGGINEAAGDVLAFSYPFSDLSTVELDRKKGIFGGLKAKFVDLTTIAPPAVLRFEPVLAHPVDGGAPYQTSMDTFMVCVVEAACDARLSGDGIDDANRRRLEAVRQGQRDVDGLTSVAWIDAAGA